HHHYPPPPFPTRRSSDLLSHSPLSVLERSDARHGVLHVAAPEHPQKRVRTLPLVMRTRGGNRIQIRYVSARSMWFQWVSIAANGDRKSTRLNSSHQIISY